MDIVPSDDVVEKIVSAEFSGPDEDEQLYYRIELKAGGYIRRPIADCACPEAIAAFERRYFRAKVDACFVDDSQASGDRHTQADVDSKAEDGTFSWPGACFNEDEDLQSESHKTDEEATADSEPSSYDDGHLNNISSDNSLWDFHVDEKGRSAKDPAVRAKIRAAWQDGDTTFKSPADDSSSSSDSSTTPKAKAKATPSSDGTDDSLMKELAAKENVSPQAMVRRKAPVKARRVLFGNKQKGKVDLGKVKLEPFSDGEDTMQPSTSKAKAKAHKSPSRMMNMWQQTAVKYEYVTLSDDDGEACAAKKAKASSAEEDVDCITLDDE